MKNNKGSMELLKSEHNINDASTHTNFLHSIAIANFRVPHLPNTFSHRLIQPFLTDFLIQLSLIQFPQTLQYKIIRSRPRGSSPHKINRKHRIECRIILSNSRNRIIWSISFLIPQSTQDCISMLSFYFRKKDGKEWLHCISSSSLELFTWSVFTHITTFLLIE